MDENTIYFGSDLKIAINVDFGEIPVEQVPFEVVFNCGGATLTLDKEQLIKVDENNFVACIKSPKTQRGMLSAYIRAQIPDADFEDHIHNVVTLVKSNIRVI